MCVRVIAKTGKIAPIMLHTELYLELNFYKTHNLPPTLISDRICAAGP